VATLWLWPSAVGMATGWNLPSLGVWLQQATGLHAHLLPSLPTGLRTTGPSWAASLEDLAFNHSRRLYQPGLPGKRLRWSCGYWRTRDQVPSLANGIAVVFASPVWRSATAERFRRACSWIGPDHPPTLMPAEMALNEPMGSIARWPLFTHLPPERLAPVLRSSLDWRPGQPATSLESVALSRPADNHLSFFACPPDSRLLFVAGYVRHLNPGGLARSMVLASPRTMLPKRARAAARLAPGTGTGPWMQLFGPEIEIRLCRVATEPQCAHGCHLSILNHGFSALAGRCLQVEGERLDAPSVDDFS